MIRPGTRATLGIGVAVCLLGWAGHATAEPTFLSKQYTRCTTCHYSPTGGGLLTPYGRSLSREEISSFGRSVDKGDASADAASVNGGEEGFLGGWLGEGLGALQLGLDLRPSHLAFTVGDTDLPDRNLWMSADLLAAYQTGAWTFYGEIGRQPGGDDWTVDSYEYWVGYQTERGLGIRAGRFLPAYGVRFADHTTFNRTAAQLTQYDQLYGVEVSVTGDRSLVQIALSPGRADALLDDDGRRAFTTTGRLQVDLTPRTVLVGSALYRGASDVEPRTTGAGIAAGLSLGPHVTTWTQMDVFFQDRLTSDRTQVFVHQTSIEVLPGVWFRVSPQIRWTDRDPQAEIRRLALGADLYPRTHWHVNLSYYRDRAQFFGLLTETFLAQLHLYL